MIAVTYKVSWMHTFGKGACWAGILLGVAKEEGPMLIRRRAIEFEGNVQESEKVYYAHEDLKTLLNKI